MIRVAIFDYGGLGQRIGIAGFGQRLGFFFQNGNKRLDQIDFLLQALFQLQYNVIHLAIVWVGRDALIGVDGRVAWLFQQIAYACDQAVSNAAGIYFKLA